MAQVVELAGVRSPVESVLGPIREKIDKARSDRRRFEPTVLSNRAFGAGKPWLQWSRSDRRLRLNPKDVAYGQERHSADLLTQNLWTALGQLSGADDRQDLQFRREDVPSEDFAAVANKAMKYGWEVEWRAPRVFANIKRKLVIDGMAAVQCYFDPSVGKELGEVPVRDGQPILDGEDARGYVAGLAEIGLTAEYRMLNEGRICWKPRSFFELLWPPGIEDEEDFPWEAVIHAVPLDKLVERYGDVARQVKPEPLTVMEQLGMKDGVDLAFGTDPEGDPGTPGKLEDHAALIEFYERPTRKFPRGRRLDFAQEVLLDMDDKLPYRTPRGDWRSGIVYFHYWRVEGRFHGRALIEGGKGIQRTYNKRLQQEHLTIDRAQPFVMVDEFTDEDAIKKTPEPMEIVRLGNPAARPPQIVQGAAVHADIWRSKDGLIQDLERAMGIHGVSTGEAPTRETTYAELALRSEKDRTKLDPITEDFQRGVGELIELSVWDIRRYWSAEKVKAIAGEEEYAEVVNFKGSDLPDFFLVEKAKGSKPRTEAAEIQLVMDLWRASQEEAAAMQQPPRLDLDWLKGSLEAGKALDFPEGPTDVHVQKARWENTLLLKGELVEPSYFDPPPVHIPIHREAQVEAQMAGDLDAYETIEMHIQLEEKLADENATKAAFEQMQAQAGLEGELQAQEAQGEQASSEADHQRQLEMQAQQQAAQLEQAKQKASSTQ